MGMYFKTSFVNGLDAVECRADGDFTPLVLTVQEGGRNTRKKALEGYLTTIEYAFMGTVNNESGSIREVVMGKSWCGSVAKTLNTVNWNCSFDKYNVVVYRLGCDSFSEGYYAAEEVEQGKGVTYLALDSLDSHESAIIKKNMMVSIVVFSRCISKYNLKWDDENHCLILQNKKGQTIDIESVKEDDIYTLLKFISTVIFRDVHLGVFMINAQGVTPSVLNCYLGIIRGLFGDAFVFLYNVSEKLKLNAQTVTLPNYILHDKLKNTKRK
jgi:hypothetical protein